jgi:hypothetical protein
MIAETEVRAIKPRRIARKVFDGGALYLLVTPKGGRCWRYAYRFARNLLAHGIDPAVLRAALGKHTFAATMREWGSGRADTLARLVCITRQIARIRSRLFRSILIRL